MRRRYHASYRVIRLRDALRRGLIVEVNGATVDGVIRTCRGPRAIELLGYSPLDDRGDVMARDVSFRRVIKRSLYERLKAKCYSLTLSYRERPRPIPNTGMVRTVPNERDFGAIIRELKAAISLAPPLAFSASLSIQFVAPEIAHRWHNRQGTLYLSATSFPLCAAHFNSVRLQGLADDLIPEVHSNLKVGLIGLNGKWVRRHIETKAERSLGKSRERANGLPLWLIVHSDGHAIHQTIHKTHRRRAISLCRETLNSLQHGFERAYWADNTGFLDAAWVGRVL